MTVKKYLQQAFRINQRIDSKIVQLEELNALAQKCTGVITGMLRNPSPATFGMENVVCKIVDLQNEINADIDSLVDLKAEIMHAIKTVDDIDCRLLLERRYLGMKTWEEIAYDMCKTGRNIHMLHDRALKKLSLNFTEFHLDARVDL
ncbi:MAG: hypothetical protein LUF25_00980 [Phascolarctobacterium sp.]|nr:hypothetical protein [Phascolarctobacterium sp.]